MKKLINIILGALLFTTISFSQEYTGPMSTVRYPSRVVYISPNYTNKAPHFSSLANVSSYLSDKATTLTPYVVWFDTDTTIISDWNTSKATFRSTYVETGKVKIAGFFQEGVTGIVGGGVGSYSVPIPDQQTTYYEFFTWNPSDTTLPAWVPYLANSLYTIDETMWNNRPYHIGGGISIVNDTVLTISPAYVDSLVKYRINQAISADTLIDQTDVFVTTEDDTIIANIVYENNGVTFGDSSFLRLPLDNHSEGLSRVIWSNNANEIWFSGNGGEEAYRKLAGIKEQDGFLADSNIVGWGNLAQAVRDSIQWTPAFGSLYLYINDPDTVAGSNFQSIQDMSPGVYKNITYNDSSLIIIYAGYYRVSANVTSEDNDDITTLQLYIDDVANAQVSAENVGLSAKTLVASGILYLSANDVLELKIKFNAGGGTIPRANFNIERIKD